VAGYYAALSQIMFTELNMNDFGKFYYAAKSYLAGGSLYDPTPATFIKVNPENLSEARPFLNMNPPHFHLVVLPLTLFSPLAAVQLWAAMNIGALGWSLWLIFRELRIRWRSVQSALWIGMLLLGAPTGAIVVTGQFTFLLLVPTTYAWLAARRGGWALAATLLGGLASVKPFFGIFALYLIATGRAGAAAVMGSAGAACIALGAAIFGWGAYADWTEALSSVNWAWAAMNGSVAALLSRLLAPNPFFATILNQPQLVVPLVSLFAIPIGLFSLRLARRDHSTGRVDRTFVAALLTAQLVSPLGWNYYLWLSLGPFIALWQSFESRRSPVRDALLAGAVPLILCPLIIVTVARKTPIEILTVGSAYFWATLTLWAAVVADYRVATPVSAPHTRPQPQS
jgi:alpha-1,2-mannosyltransferase